MKKQEQKQIITQNRKALYDYEIKETSEAGIILKGTEVKSCSEHHISLQDAYIEIKNGKPIMHNSSIARYECGIYTNHEEKADRILLMHKKEIRRLNIKLKENGMTLVPLDMHISNGKFKITVGLCRGRHVYDKREAMKKEESRKEIKRFT